MKTQALVAGTAATLIGPVLSQHYGGPAGLPDGVGDGYTTYAASDHPIWPTQTGSALSAIIDGSSTASYGHPTGPPAGVASSYSAEYAGATSYGPENHPTSPLSSVASSSSAQPTSYETYGPDNHPTASVTEIGGVSTAVATAIPSSLSSWIAHSDWTTYGPDNHPTTALSDVPASVSSYFVNSAWTTYNSANHPTSGTGSAAANPYGPGAYTQWMNTASEALTAGACPPASWSGWTQGPWATDPAWTTWSGCTAAQSKITMQVTEVNTVGATQTSLATVLETVVSYAGIAAVTAGPDGAQATGAAAMASSSSSGSSSGGNVSAEKCSSVAAIGLLVVLVVIL